MGLHGFGRTETIQNGLWQPERRLLPATKSGFIKEPGLRFRLLSICIEPCYVFTIDGNTPLEGKLVGPLSIKWGGEARNAAILRHIVFWARTLARRQLRIEIQTGAQPIVISGIPAFARAHFGIEFDHIGVKSLLAQVDDELQVAAESLSISFSQDEDADEAEGEATDE